MIPPVVASDRGRAQTVCVLQVHVRGCRERFIMMQIVAGRFWKVPSERVISPYGFGLYHMRLPE